ncbi:MAG: hypothetical protein KDD66_04740 [Bdellovibrionales bacterium]|nr:hypothetical protein [Bdellovibrionales bacterium]
MVLKTVFKHSGSAGVLRALRHLALAACLCLVFCDTAAARDVRYSGSEQTVYVKPGEPTQVSFPSGIEGGFRRRNSAVKIERQDNHLIVFAQPELSPEGEAIIVHLDDKRTYSIRVTPADDVNVRDDRVKIIDDRVPEVDVEGPTYTDSEKPSKFAPPTVVSGLMREMILVAEFGKKKGIPGYRRSNRYSGETVMHDGAISAKVDEIFMGTDLWGYVIDVENLLNTSQRLNPATFRLDGTRAVSAERWELAPRPLTAEQQISNQHRSKIYVITRSKRR